MVKQMAGPAYVMLGALLWSFAGLAVKFIPWHPLSIACVRGVTAAITIALVRRKWRPKLNKATAWASVCMLATTILFMFANKLTSAANAIVLQYTAPVYVLLASALIRKTRLRLVDILTVIFTIVGVVLFFVDRLGEGALLGNSVALVSGMTFAGVFFFNSDPSASPEDASFIGCGLSIFLVPMLFFDPQVSAGGWTPWVAVILLGVIQLGLGYYFFSKGVQQTGAVTAVIISAAEPILNPVWVFLVLRERPGILSIIGGIVVIVTICGYNMLGARQKETATASAAVEA